MHRPVILVLCLAVGYGVVHELGPPGDLDPRAMLAPDVDPDLHTALEVRCGDLAGWQRSECETGLAARFDAGLTDPESVLRIHCTRVRNPWETQPSPVPPAICTQRFGGWVAG